MATIASTHAPSARRRRRSAIMARAASATRCRRRSAARRAGTRMRPCSDVSDEATRATRAHPRRPVQPRRSGTPAERAERLQRVRDRLAARQASSPREHRDQRSAALDREIAARLREAISGLALLFPPPAMPHAGDGGLAHRQGRAGRARWCGGCWPAIPRPSPIPAPRPISSANGRGRGDRSGPGPARPCRGDPRRHARRADRGDPVHPHPSRPQPGEPAARRGDRRADRRLRAAGARG